VFLADDIVLFPFKSILSVFREIYNAAVQEIVAEADGIRTELSQLYLALEAGTVSEATFDDRERELLDRLDTIEERGLLEDEEDAEDEDDEDDEDPEI
jgi:gas vesicle protein GvpG